MPGEEEQYKAFREVYGTDTNESHRPSLEKKSTVKTLLFSSTIRHIQNADIMPECEQCGRWRLLYSQYKLTNERTVLENELEEISFTCGSPLQDLDLPGKLPKVYAWDIACEEPNERLYYTAKYPRICNYCGYTQETDSVLLSTAPITTAVP